MERKPAFAVPRLLRHALRLLVLLGGTLVCWLLLSNAPAQADGSEDAAAGGHPVVSGVDAVSTTTHPVADELRRTPPRVERTLRQATRSAPAPVRATVADVVATVEPTLARATDAAGGAVDRTVDTVATVVEPVVAATSRGGVAAASTPLAEAEHPAATGHRAHRTAAPGTPFGAAPSVPSGDSRSVPSWGTQLESTRGLPGPDEPTSPAGSWSGPSGATATLAGMLLLLFLTLRGGRVRDDADLPSGPAYPPGSSPG